MKTLLWIAVGFVLLYLNPWLLSPWMLIMIAVAWMNSRREGP